MIKVADRVGYDRDWLDNIRANSYTRKRKGTVVAVNRYATQPDIVSVEWDDSLMDNALSCNLRTIKRIGA